MGKQSWNDYEKAAEKGPISIGVKIILALFVVGIVIIAVTARPGWFGESAQVVKEEFGPKAALEKYEWFKDAAAELEKKRADITVYESRMTAMEESYEGDKRKDWHREDREQYNVWSSEIAGVIASYNSLAAEYNAQMAKFNWRFANVGELPEGAGEPLPQEFKEYMEK